MKRIYILLFAMAIVFPSGSAFAHEGHDHDQEVGQDASAETAETKKYVCPMHPDVQSDKPGECPKCGMTLEQVTTENQESEEDSHREHAH